MEQRLLRLSHKRQTLSMDLPYCHERRQGKKGSTTIVSVEGLAGSPFSILAQVVWSAGAGGTGFNNGETIGEKTLIKVQSRRWQILKLRTSGLTIWTFYRLIILLILSQTKSFQFLIWCCDKCPPSILQSGLNEVLHPQHSYWIVHAGGAWLSIKINPCHAG